MLISPPHFRVFVSLNFLGFSSPLPSTALFHIRYCSTPLEITNTPVFNPHLPHLPLQIRTFDPFPRSRLSLSFLPTLPLQNHLPHYLTPITISTPGICRVCPPLSAKLSYHHFVCFFLVPLCLSPFSFRLNLCPIVILVFFPSSQRFWVNRMTLLVLPESLICLSFMIDLFQLHFASFELLHLSSLRHIPCSFTHFVLNTNLLLIFSRFPFANRIFTFIPLSSTISHFIFTQSLNHIIIYRPIHSLPQTNYY